jgi:choice-of-anchor A domain-containing protein
MQKALLLVLSVLLVGTGAVDYIRKASAIEDLQRLEADAEELANVIEGVIAEAEAEEGTAPMSCEDIGLQIAYLENRECNGDRRCISSVARQLGSARAYWSMYCASPSSTPSSSVAPSLPYDPPGCGCLDNTEVFNTMVFENYDASSDCQGRLAVGGDASMSGFSVGDQLPESYGELDHLIVGGKMTYITGRVYGGNIVYGSEESEVGDSVIHGLLRGSSIIYNPDRIDWDYYSNYYREMSTNLCSLNDTAVVLKDNGHARTTRANIEPEVMSLTCDDLDSLLSIDFTGISGSESLLINVRGDQCQFLIEQILPNPEKVLWNFCEATRLGIEGVGVQGSILAPFADAISNSGVIHGQSVTKSWSGHAQQNNVLCYACFPGTVPGFLHPSSSPSPSASVPAA